MATEIMDALSGVLHPVRTDASLTEALQDGGIDFDVAEYPVEAVGVSISITPEGVTRSNMPMPENKAIVKVEHGVVTKPFRTVGKSYGLLNNEQSFAPLEYLREEGLIKGFTMAGGINDGMKSWVLAELAAESTIQGDPHMRYILAGTTHDGSGSVFIRAVQERLSCRNQVPTLLRGWGSAFSLRHTSTVSQRVEATKSGLVEIIRYMDKWDEAYERLMNESVTTLQAEHFFSDLVPDVGANASVRQREASEQAIAAMRNIYYHSSTQSDLLGTKAGLLHSAIEYSDWWSPTRGNNVAASRAKRILAGRDQAFKQSAYDLVAA